jgi:hypothetical protein
MEIKVKLSNTEHKDLLSYCNLNDLLISEVVKKSFTTGFNIERYGLLNPGGTQEKVVEKEVVVEKRVEIPVEVIKEIVQVEYVEVPVEKIVEVVKEVSVDKIVEVIKEVPVDRVIEKIVEVVKEVPVEKVVIKEIVKEVPVEKVVYVTDHEEMRQKISEKEKEFEKETENFSVKTRELEKIFQNEKNELLSKIQQLENKPAEIVEVIKEVPVEVIKEVIIEGGDKSKLDALQSTVMKLRQETLEKDKKLREYEKTIQDIQKFQEDKKAVYLSGSNLNKTL